MQKQILVVPNPKLRRVSKPIKSLDLATNDFLLDLAETLKKARNPEGVGLSAPQLGKSIRAFASFLDHKIRFYLNPEVLDQDEELTLGGTSDRPVLEGCLSIPALYGPVYRPKKIKIKALSEKGEQFTRTLTSFSARVFLHELDHLDGILFTDYTLRDNLPLYLLQGEEFTRLDNPPAIIKW